ncbi:hypothetical protein F5I97DRAFT_1996070 [Phlebopus sp. FC_14]|nr:hypothetical protein F5I97DRAFT_1996070 [Phlebopus sp. FC_14]
MSLALDSTTQLEGRAAPEGILYTAGRDGQVISWDLGLSFRRARSQSRRARVGRWETLTGMAEGSVDEEPDEIERRDGDVLGDVKERGSRMRRGRLYGDALRHDYWELDMEGQHPGTVRHTQFRQCAQMHTDWVNDILLCNHNQTVISASSDGAIKSWRPHSTSSIDPSTIGFHTDYARCLALCREQGWIISGSFDRTIKLWDLTRSSSTQQPLVTLHAPDATATKASVYALASDPYGHNIASGSPERVIRMWDPRSGKRTGKLVGHTDNIRAILISDDARYLLTGSADASIKLWSLSSQRCLHTFTYHTDSVWSLHSTHPSLEVFYSGDKSGIVCKVDVEDCLDVADATCIVLAQDPSEEAGEGINKIVTADEGLLWTASGRSTVSRWKVPKRISRRNAEEGGDMFADSPVAAVTRRRESLGMDSPSTHQVKIWIYSLDGGGRKDDESPLYPSVTLASLVRLTSPNGPFSPSPVSKGRDADVATLYSAASILSIPGRRSPFNTVFQPSTAFVPSTTLRTMRSDASISNADDPTHDARTAYELPEIASDAVPFNAVADSVVPGSHGLVRAILLNDRMHALTVDTKGEVAVWDIVRCVCRGNYIREDVRAASRCGSTNSSAVVRENGSVSGGDKERSAREALEAVRERIEGEAVVSPWSTVDTKTGVLTVHLNERCFDAEIYADEAGFQDKHFNDELRFNVGKWMLRNLFIGFIKEEQRVRRKRDGHVPDSNPSGHPNLHRGTAPAHIDLNGNSSGSFGRRSPSDISSRTLSRVLISTAVISSPNALPAVVPPPSTAIKSSPLLTPMIPLNAMKVAQPLSTITQSRPPTEDRTPMPRPIVTQGLEIPPPSATRDTDYFSSPIRRPSTASTALSDGDFSGWGGPGSPPRQPPESSMPLSPNSPSGGGFMGRLKNFGKGSSRKAVSDTATGSPMMTSFGNVTDTTTVPEEPEASATKAPVQTILTNPISPPSSSEAPTISLPPNMTIMMSDESYPGWKTIYRGSVSSTWTDIYTLEETMPLWLLEYLLFNKLVTPQSVKISFVLLPWSNPDPTGVQLPELLNTAQSKLTASKFLRVRKLTHHVQDKLEKLSEGSNSSSSSPVDPSITNLLNPRNHRGRAEELYEILCNDLVLPLDMTLAAVRQYFWRQATELTMHYRLRMPQSVVENTDVSASQPF